MEHGKTTTMEMEVIICESENDDLLHTGSGVDSKNNNPEVQTVNTRIYIQRPIYTQDQFDLEFGQANQSEKQKRERLISKLKSSCTCNKKCFIAKLFQLFPCIGIMRQYEWKSWLVSDIIAGLCVGVIHIPQSMGFSLLTSLPPIYGLYSTIYPILIYFFFGSSKHISVGTMAVISLMIGAIVERETESFEPMIANDSNITDAFTGTNDTGSNGAITITTEAELIEFKVGIATSVTLLVGLIQLVMYVLNLGVLASFMSMSFIGGFMTGAACHIVTSQVPFMLGIKPPREAGAFRLPKTWFSIFRLLGDTNVAELVISMLCIIILIILKEIINEKFKNKLKVPIPAELIVVAIGILVSYFAKLNDYFDVRIIANVPTGLPAPKVPTMHNAHTYITDAFAIALVSYAVSVSLAKTFAQQFQYSIDQNQEMLAHGLMHTISSFFLCFGGAQAPPRTLVHVNIGGKTQVASLVSMLMVILVCILMGPVIEPLPNSVLAAVITVALFPLFKQFKYLPGFWRINKQDFLIWIITFLAVVILNVDLGLYIGIATGLFLLIIQTKTASTKRLTQAGSTELYCPLNKHDTSESDSPVVQVFRFASPLYFANVDNFKSSLFAATVNPNETKVVLHRAAGNLKTHNNDNVTNFVREKAQSVKGIVLDCSVIFYIDLMGLSVLKHLMESYAKAGICLVLSSSNEDLRQKLVRYGIKIENCFPSVQDAVVFLQNQIAAK